VCVCLPSGSGHFKHWPHGSEGPGASASCLIALHCIYFLESSLAFQREGKIPWWVHELNSPLEMGPCVKNQTPCFDLYQLSNLPPTQGHCPSPGRCVMLGSVLLVPLRGMDSSLMRWVQDSLCLAGCPGAPEAPHGDPAMGCWFPPHLSPMTGTV
jgi:hypothetical protein